MFCENAFGVELDAEDGELTMADSHDFFFLGFGCDFEAIGDGFAADDEGVVSGCCERAGQSFEQAFAVVIDRGGFAMHHAVIDDDIPTKYVADALMAEANPEERDSGAEGSNDVVRKAGLFWGARAWGDENLVGVQRLDLVDANLVVAMHLHSDAHFA